MESNIVRDFKNLRVFAKHNLISMDELVHDLTTALEETASGNNLPEGALSKRYIKKRRGIRRTQSSWKSRGTISEASESSIDEQQGCDIAGSIAHSDSDDLVSSHRFSKLVMPIVDTVPLIESDSFTENLSPMRPQRRRRKFKSMAVDSSPLTDHGPSDVDLIPSTDKLHIHKHSDATSSMFISDRLGSSEDQHSSATSGPSYSIMSGKRKRSTKCKVDYSSPQAESTLQTMSKAILDRMEVTSISQESSLSSSEFDSDINVNNEDAREADDEQSDFFHEPGPACGIPDIVPWWENERVTDKPLRVNSDFEKILTGTFEHLPKYGSQSFKAKVGKLVSGAGREIRLGRRKLKGKMPRYTVGRFLQDREHWSRLQDPHHSYPSMAASSNITISTNNNNNNNNNVASNNNNGNSSNNNNNNNSNNNNNNGNSNNNNNNGNSNNNNSGPQAGEFKKRRHVQRNCVGEGSPLAIEGSSMDSKPSSHRTSLCTTVSKSSSSPTIPRRRSSRKTGSSSVSDS